MLVSWRGKSKESRRQSLVLERNYLAGSVIIEALSDHFQIVRVVELVLERFLAAAQQVGRPEAVVAYSHE
jgi:hypothetical protein